MSYLENLLAVGVNDAHPSFDSSKLEDCLALIAFADSDDDLSSYQAEGMIEVIQSRIEIDTHPEKIDDMLGDQKFQPFENAMRWGVPWDHVKLTEVSVDLQVWNDALKGAAQTEAMYAAIEPAAFARDAIDQEYDTDWIFNRSALPKVLCFWGANPLIEALNCCSPDAFTVLSPMVACIGWFFATQSDLPDDVLLAIAEDPTNADRQQNAFTFCYVIDSDETRQNALVQACAVAELNRRGLEHPAFDGCPGTGSAITDEEAEQVAAMTAGENPEEEALFHVVRTIDERRGEAARADLNEIIDRTKKLSLHALAAAMQMTYVVDDETQHAWLRTFETCDPRMGDFVREQIGVWLLRRRETE